jgi:hypothetical protein
MKNKLFMKRELIILFCLFTSLKSFSQNVFTKIFFNGIDTFFIGDKKTKYINSNTKNNFTLMQTDVVKNDSIENYGKNKDSLAAFKIDTISFRSMMFTFNNSELATIDLSQFYELENYANPIKIAKGKMDFLRKKINTELQKKGKAKDFGSYSTSQYFGYEWKNGDFVIILSIYNDLVIQKFVSLSLYISNRKLEAKY